MRAYTPETITDAVIEQMSRRPIRALREIMEARLDTCTPSRARST